MLKMILQLALAVLLGTPAGAQVALHQTERFELFNECRPMDLTVLFLDLDGGTGLTKDRIQTMAESRLRAARLYDADAETLLGVYVVLDGAGAFKWEVIYYKPLYDAVSGETLTRKTWISENNAGVGIQFRSGIFRLSYDTHGGDADVIMQGLSERLDKFILEYLRVNEASCGA